MGVLKKVESCGEDLGATAPYRYLHLLLAAVAPRFPQKPS